MTTKTKTKKCEECGKKVKTLYYNRFCLSCGREYQEMLDAEGDASYNPHEMHNALWRPEDD